MDGLKFVLLTFTIIATCVDSSYADTERCPENWVKHGSSCYFWVITGRSWDDAAYNCRQHGGQLAVIESEEENTFVASMRNSQMDDAEVWLGCNDTDVEGTFMCIAEGGVQPIGYINWATGQPSNKNGDHHCLIMKTKSGGWYDKNCEDTEFFAVCKRGTIIPRQTCGTSSGLYCITLDSNGRPRI